MRLSESDRDSNLSVSPDLSALAGPSSAPFDSPGHPNGHANGNGFTAPLTNGSSGVGVVMGNGVQKHSKSIARVNLPGTTLYDDSLIDREEFVRLVIQSLRDVGYIESAATLEAESGYSMESSEVSEFRQFILNASWTQAETALMHLGVNDEEGLLDAKFLISQQKYLELLESQKTTAALHVLRNEIAPLNVDPDQLHTLSSYMMCSDPEDLRQRAAWDGAYGTSRRRLLSSLHRYIPSSVMIPQRRFSTLLHQARLYQRQRCVYHNSPNNSAPFSLYADHQCDKSGFPRITTTILEVHTDEVWNMEWSHDGAYLASASKDKTAIIWRVGPEAESAIREWTPHLILREHEYPVGCLAWSMDDTILLTGAEQFIRMWNTKTGVCQHRLEAHTDTVAALAWLPDGSGFISGGLDRKVIQWDTEGKQRETWEEPAVRGEPAVRITDLAITPDFTRLVVVGMHDVPITPPLIELNHSRGGQTGESAAQQGSGNIVVVNGRRKPDSCIIVYDLATKQIESSTRFKGELSTVKVSQNSQYALINHSPNEIHLWDLDAGRLARKFTGHIQEHHVIRNCFGGVEGNFVVSGSEDGNVYVWHRDTGALLEVLSGHGEGSVNSVAWNPRNERMFASCSDDHTIRIWEAPLSDVAADSPFETDPQSSSNGKGKTRQRGDGDSGDFSSGGSPQL